MKTEKEAEKLMIADMLEAYGEEMVFMMAKGLNYPATNGLKNVNDHSMDKLIDNMTESFVSVIIR